MIKEFQRLKEVENKSLDWDIKRNLSKINYHLGAVSCTNIFICCMAIWLSFVSLSACGSLSFINTAFKFSKLDKRKQIFRLGYKTKPKQNKLRHTYGCH
jgi:hypothetical protein